MTRWTQKHLLWIKGLIFEQFALKVTLEDHVQEIDHVTRRIERLETNIDEAISQMPMAMQEVIAALQGLRGVGKITAATVVTELGQLSRFASPRQLMAYCGLVPSEHSSGGKTQRGSISKSGNAHLRRVLGEAVFAYQHRPWLGGWLAKRQQGMEPALIEISWKAQHRLHKRYKHLLEAGKNKGQVMTALARELTGFLWHIATTVEANQQAVKVARQAA
jgi:transposase